MKSFYSIAGQHERIVAQMARYFFEISDVIVYLRTQTAVSGIQRVQLELIRYIIALNRGADHFIVESRQPNCLMVADHALLLKLVALMDGSQIENRSARRAQLNALLTAISTSAAATVDASENDVLFISGAFWASDVTLNTLSVARKLGMMSGLLCYDLIPLTNPEFCDAGVVVLFSEILETALAHVDFIFTISNHVKRDVEWQLAYLNLDIPVISLPLAHQLAPVNRTLPLGPIVQDLVTKHYVLLVSTIEARKNHAYAALLWQRLLAIFPRGQVPDLVWVGRPGWLVDDLLTRLKRQDWLGGKLHIISSLQDHELSALYEHCWFTIYPSYVEGWGLPVAESLAFAKPCLASNTTSIPEVGGKFVWYMDPDNVSETVKFVSSLIEKPTLVDERAHWIRAEFRARTWADVFDKLLSDLGHLSATLERQTVLTNQLIIPGSIYAAGRFQTPDSTSITSLVLGRTLGDGWYGADVWVRWLKGQKGTLRLVLYPSSNKNSHRIFLQLQAKDFWKGDRVVVTCPQTNQSISLPIKASERRDFQLQMDLPLGSFELEFKVDRFDISGTCLRPMSIGLLTMGIASTDSPESCRNLIGKTSNDPFAPIYKAKTGDPSPPVLEFRTSRTSQRLIYFLKRSYNEGITPTFARIHGRIKYVYNNFK